MGFTTPCFIRKNTPELRKKLEELGYKECIGEEGPFLFTSHNIFDCMYTECGLNDLAYNGLIDCGTNENLFLAIAALRDDTNENQWFICDVNHWDRADNGELTVYAEIGEWIFCKSNDDDCVQDNHYHKATVEELIEHFKGKE